MKLVFGVGVNDANYVTQVKETTGYDEKGKQVQKLIWLCPFYQKWKDMLKRCYSEKYHIKQPTYKSCSVTPEWHYFMTFRAWMIQQEWEGKDLDKDLLLPGNKIYGPESCIFVDRDINTFMQDCEKRRGDFPLGVYFHKASGKYMARCSDPEESKMVYLGLFTDANIAHLAWKKEKLNQAKKLASKQKDERLVKLLLSKYQEIENA